MAGNDIAEKILEDYDDVFADIINVLLFGGEEIVSPEDLRSGNVKSAYKIDGKLHDIERDVLKLWIKQQIRFALIGFENQTGVDKYMPIRAFGYDGADYRAQLNDKD